MIKQALDKVKIKVWSDKQKKIVGAIFGIASDKRSRVLMEDQIIWMEKKFKEIRRLAKKLPQIEWDGKKI